VIGPGSADLDLVFGDLRRLRFGGAARESLGEAMEPPAVSHFLTPAV
jgi:hypothetical protein